MSKSGVAEDQKEKGKKKAVDEDELDSDHWNSDASEVSEVDEVVMREAGRSTPPRMTGVKELESPLKERKDAEVSFLEHAVMVMS